VDVVIQLIFSLTHLLNADSEAAFTPWATTMHTAVTVVLHTFDLVVAMEHRFLTNTGHKRLKLMTIWASLKKL
jgi:hypothetical protein